MMATIKHQKAELNNFNSVIERNKTLETNSGKKLSDLYLQ